MDTLETPSIRPNTSQLFARLSLFAFLTLGVNIYYNLFHGTFSHGYQPYPTYTPVERLNNTLILISFCTGVGGAVLSVIRKEKWTFIKVIATVLNGIVAFLYALLLIVD